MSRALAICGALLGTLAPGRTALAGVVGNGTAGSCTEAAFDSQLAGGGTITFNCGGSSVAPVTITFTTPKAINGPGPVRIDGGFRIALSGGNAVGLFTVGAAGNLTLENATVRNGARTGDGGCIANSGTLTLNSLTVQDCAATGNGGAIDNTGTLNISIATVRRNTAGGNGGGIRNAGTLAAVDMVIGRNAASRGGGLRNTGTATIESAVIRGNTATLEGGGVHNAPGATLTLRAGELPCEVGSRNAGDGDANVAGTTGGGLHNDGTTTLTAVWITRNTAANGAGVANGTTGSLIANNVALTRNAASADGGGLDNAGGATLTNTTFSENQAGSGGALLTRNGTVSLVHVTMCDDAGGAIARSGGTLTVRSSAVAPATGTACVGSVTSAGYNVVADPTCAFGATGDQTTNPSLATLDFVGDSGQTNELFTPVCLPQTGSPVLDAATGPNCPAKDQRGRARPFGPACDVGAVEVSASDPTVTTTTTTTTSTITIATTTTLPGGGTTTTTPPGVTTTSSLPPGVTTTTTSPGGPTTTTVPGGARCAGVPRAATFESADCRFAALSEAMDALDGVTPRAPKLRAKLNRAAGPFQQARATCLGGNGKAAGKQLKKAFRSLSSLRKLLASKASKSVPDRDLLRSVVDGLRLDVKTMSRGVSCPADAAAPA